MAKKKQRATKYVVGHDRGGIVWGRRAFLPMGHDEHQPDDFLEAMTAAEALAALPTMPASNARIFKLVPVSPEEVE